MTAPTELLRYAADLLRERGLTTGALAVNGDGAPTWPADRRAVAYSLRGALQCAADRLLPEPDRKAALTAAHRLLTQTGRFRSEAELWAWAEAADRLDAIGLITVALLRERNRGA